MVRGRLAPSPTGHIHLGNAWAFLLAWLLCRHRQGQLVLRLEDIDPSRSRREYATAIMEDLHWLGLDWDEGPTERDPNGLCGPHAPYTQSRRLPIYEKFLAELCRIDLAYPCYCTRKELRELAGAPHIGDEGAPYPGTCRELTLNARQSLDEQGKRASFRLRCPDKEISFTDGVLGYQSFSFAQCGGDFALRRSDGVFSYQLAVSVDDACMGINQVVRGRDILASTPRQLYLFELLNAPAPEYVHVPLVCDHKGERLAKRHASLELRALRSAGIKPESIIGYLAWKGGLQAELRPLRASRLLEDFSGFPGWWRQRDIVIDEHPARMLPSAV